MKYKFTVRSCNPQDPRDRVAYERLKEGAVFVHLLNRPGYHVDKNLFFAEAGGVIIGYVNVLPELGIGRVILEYGVSPSYSLETILERLFHRALGRVGGLGARVAHVNILEVESAQGEFLSNLGFRVVRRFYEMRLDVARVNLEAFDQRDLVYRHLSAGENELLARIENRCFTGTWGFNPNTAEYIAWEISTRGGCHDDVILASSDDKPIGYCWTEAQCGRDSSTGRSKGRIYMIGVDPNYRKRGVGRKLLKTGLLHLKSKGREIIDITVDSQNVAAVALYHSLGFQTWAETIWYEKVIR
ncbi:MAG: GNAT family N-acetyltransferase [Chloroflexi bacterium]|nr:GNAT family N-acetyltransferase [Chloroflexota bacterium]